MASSMIRVVCKKHPNTFKKQTNMAGTTVTWHKLVLSGFWGGDSHQSWARNQKVKKK